MGSHLSKPLTSLHVKRLSNKNHRVATLCSQGCRKLMQDSHFTVMSDKLSIFGVNDGHSEHGKWIADYISKQLPIKIMAVNNDITKFLDLYKQLDIECKENVIKEFNIKEYDIDDIGGTTSCTVISEYIGKNTYKLTLCNIGDSLCIILDNDGKIVDQTVSHTTNLESERSRIINSGGFIKNNRVLGELEPTRCFGDYKYKKGKYVENHYVIPVPEIRHFEVKAGYKILILCDGFTEKNTRSQIIDFINRDDMNYMCEDFKYDPLPALIRLVNHCFSLNTTDNMTGILVGLDDGSKYSPLDLYVPCEFKKQYNKNKHIDFVKEYIREVTSHGLTIEQAIDLGKPDNHNKLLEQNDIYL